MPDSAFLARPPCFCDFPPVPLGIPTSLKASGFDSDSLGSRRTDGVGRGTGLGGPGVLTSFLQTGRTFSGREKRGG